VTTKEHTLGGVYRHRRVEHVLVDALPRLQLAQLLVHLGDRQRLHAAAVPDPLYERAARTWPEVPGRFLEWGGTKNRPLIVRSERGHHALVVPDASHEVCNPSPGCDGGQSLCERARGMERHVKCLHWTESGHHEGRHAHFYC
jgi:hypothetical protein